MRRNEDTMTLQECYRKMGGDYAEVLSRLRKEERIEKFMLKFLEDATFRLLCEAGQEGNDEEVFQAIHTLKGVSQNLGFGELYRASSAMTEAVRGGKKPEDESLFEEVERAYNQTIEVIREYQQNLRFSKEM